MEDDIGERGDPRMRMGRRHVYAIVRLDQWSQGEEGVTVVRVLDTTDREVAEREAVRLNEVNVSKPCRYFAQVTRLVAVEDT